MVQAKTRARARREARTSEHFCGGHNAAAQAMPLFERRQSHAHTAAAKQHDVSGRLALLQALNVDRVLLQPLTKAL